MPDQNRIVIKYNGKCEDIKVTKYDQQHSEHKKRGKKRVCTGGPSESLWITNGKSIYFTPETGAGVSIGKTTAVQTLDISGSFSVSKTSFLSTISEKVLVATDMSDNTYTFDYSQGGIYFLSGGHTNTKTLGLKINNMPNLSQSPSHTYSINVIMKGSSSTFSYADKIQVSDSSSNYIEIIPRFPSNKADTISSLANITSSDYITQHFAYIYLDGSGQVFSSINSFV